MKPIQLLRLFLLTLVCAFSAAAFAQWQWIDKDGRRVFSDRAPPPEVPQKNILKQPSNTGKAVAVPVATETAATPEAASAAAPASSTPKILSVDKDLEFLESLTDEKLRQMDPADIPKLLAQLRNQLDESRKRGQELEEQVARRKQILKQLDAAK